MKRTKNHDRSGATFRLRRRPQIWLAGLLLLGAVLMGAQQGSQAGQSAAPSTSASQSQSQSIDAAEAQRKKQIADESARLLALATDLKTEVDKTDKDTLSIAVVRKAGEIERLAHSVKERMKLASATH